MAADKEPTIYVKELDHSALEMCLVGTSPLLLNEMSEKVRRELLLPKGKKSTAEKATSIKHDPFREFRDAARKFSDPEAPTLIAFPAPAIKSAMMTAALRLPGAKKTEIGQLVWITDYSIPIWGIPELSMMVTRSADFSHTPDVRTRPMLKRWAAKVVVNYMTPHLNSQTITNLLSGAGMLAGIGDFRQEKGKGAFGQFRICSDTDSEFQDLMTNGGRAAQIKAMANPIAADDETSKLLSWFEAEVDTRGKRSLMEVVKKEVA
jgi:hypothetical protein